jgi:hypothetical protein
MAKNTLKRPQARKVEDWLLVEKNWKDIESRRLSKEDAASLATTAIGFTVTAANLETCVEAIDKKWPATGTKKSKAAYQVIVLRAAVKHLYETSLIQAPTEAIARVLGLPLQKPPEHEPISEQTPAGD